MKTLFDNCDVFFPFLFFFFQVIFVIRFFKKPLQALKERKYDDVIPLCTEVIKSSEFDTLPSSKFEVLLLRATFYVLLGKQDAAIKDFERVVTSKDASEDVRINALIKRANLYAQLEILELAHKDFDSAISINPKCSDIYHHRGVLQVLPTHI